MKAQTDDRRFDLHFLQADWEAQVARVRDARTDPTPLIRFDNAFYRICRDLNDATFQIRLSCGSETQSVDLTLRYRDLYVTHIDHHVFETYAMTFKDFDLSPMAVDSALQGLRKTTGKKLFEMQSVLVFCVAESLRNDHMATTIGQAIRASTQALRGADPHIKVGAMAAEFNAWGKTSEAILRALLPATRDELFRTQGHVGDVFFKHWQRVALLPSDRHLDSYARNLKVLKLPGGLI
jgi:hypothetical protein